MRFRADDRDHGLRRVSSVTRWLAAGAVALVGALSAMVAQAVPGASAPTTSPQQPAASPVTAVPQSSSPSLATDPNAADPGLRPAPPPVATRRQSVVSSGGS